MSWSIPTKLRLQLYVRGMFTFNKHSKETTCTCRKLMVFCVLISSGLLPSQYLCYFEKVLVVLVVRRGQKMHYAQFYKWSRSCQSISLFDLAFNSHIICRMYELVHDGRLDSKCCEVIMDRFEFVQKEIHYIIAKG